MIQSNNIICLSLVARTIVLFSLCIDSCLYNMYNIILVKTMLFLSFKCSLQILVNSFLETTLSGTYHSFWFFLGGGGVGWVTKATKERRTSSQNDKRCWGAPSERGPSPHTQPQAALSRPLRPPPPPRSGPPAPPAHPRPSAPLTAAPSDTPKADEDALKFLWKLF